MDKIYVVPIFSPNVLGKELEGEVQEFVADLNTLDGFHFEQASLRQKLDGPAILLIQGGGTEVPTIEYLSDKSDPTIFLTYPFNNSFPAALEVLAYLQAVGRTGVLVQLQGDWKNELSQLLQAYLAGRKLKTLRIGRMGQEDKTRYPFGGPVEELIKRNWGPAIVDIPLDLLEAKQKEYVGHPQVKKLAEEMVKDSLKTIEPSDEDIQGAVEIYLALKDVVAEYEVDAIALKCFDILPIFENTACYALAKLNEEGIVAACEGDIVSAAGMLILQEITGQASFMGNPNKIEVDQGLMTIAHCTLPRTMSSDYIIRSHFETGIGVSFQGIMPEDEYTVFRIGGKDLNEMFLAVGDYYKSDYRENRCRTQLTLQFKDKGKVREMLSKPLGNHHMVVRGNHEKLLRHYYDLFVKNGF